LRIWVSESESLGFTMLRHPLVYQVPFYSWKMANKSLEAKLEELQKAEANKNWSQYLWWYERPHRIPQLMGLWREKKITKDQLRELLGDVWRDTEMPRQFGIKKIVKLFRDAGFINDTDGSGFNPIAVPTPIYRGVNSLSKNYVRGISWTRSPRTAEFFARRFAGSTGGMVAKTMVDPAACLAVLSNRDEFEILVDPDMLGHIEIIEKGVKHNG